SRMRRYRQRSDRPAGAAHEAAKTLRRRRIWRPIVPRSGTTSGSPLGRASEDHRPVGPPPRHESVGQTGRIGLPPPPDRGGAQGRQAREIPRYLSLTAVAAREAYRTPRIAPVRSIESNTTSRHPLLNEIPNFPTCSNRTINRIYSVRR